MKFQLLRFNEIIIFVMLSTRFILILRRKTIILPLVPNIVASIEMLSEIFSGPRGASGLTQPSEEELEAFWDNISSELSAIFQGRGEIPQEVTPFDAASEVDVDLQR